MTRDHRGIAERELRRLAAEGDEEAAAELRALRAPVGHPVDPDPVHKRCLACQRAIHYRRRSYGPNGRAGGWAHTGDGLGQFRSWRAPG